MKTGFSIRYKFLTVMSLLLAACVCVYLLIAVRVFKADKTELVYDLNRSQVSNLASELDTQFEGLSDKFKLFALMTNESGSQSRWMGEIFTKDSDVVFVSLFKNNEILKRYDNKLYRETYGLKADYFDKTLPKDRSVPFDQILKQGEAVWNASSAGNPPLIGYGRRVVVEDSRGVAIDQMAVVGYVKPDRILKSLSLSRLSEISIATSEGELLVHPDVKTLAEKSLLAGNPLFQAAQAAKTKTSVLNFDWESDKYLGAFSKSHGGRLLVLAQAEESRAFGAVTQLVERSLIFSLIVITVAFLAAILLSRSLTGPLAELVDRMELVSQGDLTTQINIQTKDETGVLAHSFNKMIVDLKQSRDQLEEVNRDLDQKVKDRTRQLEEQNHAVKEAQEALIRTTRLASAGEIAGRAAHEVLNPLTSILTRVGIMERKIRNEMVPQVGLVQEIKNAWVKDLDTGGFDLLVSNWKEPSKISAGQNLWQEDMENIQGVSQTLLTQLDGLTEDGRFLAKEGARINKIINGMRKLSIVRSDKKKHSAHDLLKDCCHIMADLFEQRGYKVQQQFQAEKDLVMVDRDEFVQAVTNMMRNSLQAMDAARLEQKMSSGQLRLVTALIDGKVQIYIEDNGSGITTENQEKLFKSQFTTKSPEEGTGLGLGISRRFMRAYDGDIEFVSSTPYEKTVFRIILPIHVSQEVAA